MALLLWNSAAQRCTPVVPSMEGRTVAESCMGVASFHPRILRRLLHFPTMYVPLRARIELLCRETARHIAYDGHASLYGNGPLRPLSRGYDNIKIHLTKQGERELESSGSEYAVHKLWLGSCEQCELLQWRLASLIARCPIWTLHRLLS